MTIQIEAGKFYSTRCGSKVGPMRDYDDLDGYRWSGLDHSDGKNERYATDGSYFICGSEADNDLVAEWVDGPQPMTKGLLLDTAKAAVAGRGLNYGKPEDNFLRIAALWNAHIDNRTKTGPLDAADVAQLMTLMKLARLQNDPSHMDSWIDIAGYAACGAEIVGAAK